MHCYSIALQEVPTHNTPLLSMVRSFVMMLGDLDYSDTFVGDPEEVQENGLRGGILSFIFLIIFILLMPILLMNLLVRRLYDPFFIL